MATPKETRTAPLGLRVTPSLKSALEKAAADDNRAVASLVEKVLIEWLKAKRYLK
jgi:hypothetical protein